MTMFPKFALVQSWKNRKRGVSIENVMLGLVIVLIFAGLLYGAFTVVNRSLNYSNFDRMMTSMMGEGLQILEEDKRNGRANKEDYFADLATEAYNRGAVDPAYTFRSDWDDLLVGDPSSGTMVTFAYTNEEGGFGALTLGLADSSKSGFENLCARIVAESGVSLDDPTKISTYKGFNMRYDGGSCDQGYLTMRFQK